MPFLHVFIIFKQILTVLGVLLARGGSNIDTSINREPKTRFFWRYDIFIITILKKVWQVDLKLIKLFAVVFLISPVFKNLKQNEHHIYFFIQENVNKTERVSCGRVTTLCLKNHNICFNDSLWR